MGKPKDAKVWNEDLVRALDARHQKAQREGKSNAHLWRTGRDKILAVRKDIYRFRTGTIVNLPNNLKITVRRLCEDIINGVKEIYPDGHVPTNQEHASIENPSTPLSNTRRPTTGTSGSNNPFENDRYVRDITIRGGAFAILMAFRYSLTEILTKRDICREAQKFCDTEMEGNYHAGRTFGAWKAKDTLKNRNLLKEQGYKHYTPNGFRDRQHTYSLTRDGEMFIDALLKTRPEAVQAAQQAAGRDPRTPFGIGAGIGTPASTPFEANFLSPVLSGGRNKLANMENDRAELEEWLKTASVGDRKEFKVGRQRRFKLHNLCDALQRHHPGLLLTHGSSGDGRARTMMIQLVSKPSQMRPTPLATTSNQNQPKSVLELDGNPEPVRAESAAMAREKAGLAAIQRQEAAMEQIQLKTALLESKKMTPQARKPSYNAHSHQLHTPNDDADKDLERAIQASLRDSKKRTGVKRNIFATLSSSSSSDDELPGPIFSTNRKRQKRDHIIEDDRKPPAKPTNRNIFGKPPLKKTNTEVLSIDSDSDTEVHILPLKSATAFSKRTTRRKKSVGTMVATKPRAVTSEELSKAAATPNSINLCDSSDDETDDVIEIQDEHVDLSNSQHSKSNEQISNNPIDLSNSQLSQDPGFLEEPIDLSNSQLSQDPDFNNHSAHDDDDDEIIVVEDTALIASSLVTSLPKIRCPKKDNGDVTLTVWIDDRERNRNATPRTLRNELTRHLSTGSLSNVWPQRLPLAKVKESKLDWGDIQYSLEDTSNSLSNQRLGISVERKRVNDLVQRSVGGDHFSQLLRMKAHCSLSILLIENDTRTACNVTAYNAQDKEGFDPFDSTIQCEDDIYRMFGRILLTCDSIKFMQTRDEQASLRSVGALGLMAIFVPSNRTKELEGGGGNKPAKSAQALSDQLKDAGIPWKMAKRVANIVGGPIELKAMYDSCCNEMAKSRLLSHVIAVKDQGALKSSNTGWSDAIYRISTASEVSSGKKTKLSGEAALLLHKELIEDHGMYISALYKGDSPEEALEKVLDTASSKQTELPTRSVSISLTKEQETKYFPRSVTESAENTFYKISIISDDESKRQSGAITMRAVSQSLTSRSLKIFELEGSDIVNLVRDRWQGNDFVSMAKTVASLMNNLCGDPGGFSKRVLMVCGLQPALDANAKKSGYAPEMKTVVDLVFAELLLCYDITILQALRKKANDRVNLVKQLALSCLHCGYLNQRLDH